MNEYRSEAQIQGKKSSGYRSPFEQIDYDTAARSISYSGTLRDVIDELHTGISDPSSNKEILLQHPPRIIRATVNYKVAQPQSDEAHALLKDSLQLGLSVYKDPESSGDQLAAFKERAQTSNAEILDLRVVQRTDLATWEASRPEKSQETAQIIADQHKGDVLFVAMAHGGTAAGMDVFLRYQDQKGEPDESTFYVVRYSSGAETDRFPQITDKEKKYLKEQSEGKDVILFDEDQATGVTLEKAEEALDDIVKKPIHSIANMGSAAGYFTD